MWLRTNLVVAMAFVLLPVDCKKADGPANIAQNERKALEVAVTRAEPQVRQTDSKSGATGDAATSQVQPLSQDKRPHCSVPLTEPDLKSNYANWAAGLLAKSEWIWSGNLIPAAFKNNLGKYFMQIPGVFEEQLDFSTTLIFDEPSFRNGGQMSGFVDRVARELVISYIAQRRHCWYSMTHHAVLGTFTARAHGLSNDQIAAKWSQLLDYQSHPDVYTRVERAALRFAEAFSTNPKAYNDEDYKELRAALLEENRARYDKEGRWMDELAAARHAYARAIGTGATPEAANQQAAEAKKALGATLGDAENNRKADAQVVELAFLCLQFVALTDMFTALNIPDEEGLAQVMAAQVPPAVITKINQLNELGGQGLEGLMPPAPELPLQAILDGRITVAPAPLKGTRVPLKSWEEDPTLGTRDKGLAVGGIQVGVYGWSFGLYFPGGLGYLLLNHPELARHEAPYSLPLLFNEDEWRNGTQTSGYVDRLLKELAFMKVYRLTRNRYGVEHHTMFLFNEYAKAFGAGAFRLPDFTDQQAAEANKRAVAAFTNAILHLSAHDKYPEKFSELERAMLSWVEAVVLRPHTAYTLEETLRKSLDAHNRQQVAAGLRRLDRSSDLDDDAAFKRLLDHQIAELAMLVGHMDGLGRVFTILRTESESPVQIAKGEWKPDGNFAPELDAQGRLQPTGFFTNRPGFHQVLSAIGVPGEVLTANELLLNPTLNETLAKRLAAPGSRIEISADEAMKTAEF